MSDAAGSCSGDRTHLNQLWRRFAVVGSHEESVSPSPANSHAAKPPRRELAPSASADRAGRCSADQSHRKVAVAPRRIAITFAYIVLGPFYRWGRRPTCRPQPARRLQARQAKIAEAATLRRNPRQSSAMADCSARTRYGAFPAQGRYTPSPLKT